MTLTHVPPARRDVPSAVLALVKAILNESGHIAALVDAEVIHRLPTPPVYRMERLAELEALVGPGENVTALELEWLLSGPRRSHHDR